MSPPAWSLPHWIWYCAPLAAVYWVPSAAGQVKAVAVGVDALEDTLEDTLEAALGDALADELEDEIGAAMLRDRAPQTPPLSLPLTILFFM
jgi:hypothetical protein